VETVPVIDLGDVDAAARIDAACRAHGFFSITGHGIDPELCERLLGRARDFFALPDDVKAAVAMDRGGKAWRGWFPLAGELTSGVPDRKEGIYFGAEDAADDPRPLHGANLFPAEPADLHPTVLEVLDAFTALGHRVMALLAEGLGLEGDWFARHLTGDPTILFRIFHYPPRVDTDGAGDWGVAEHTDYGLLTLLLQDDAGGLQVRTGGEWVDVPPVPAALVCNLGDMLERLTGGRYRSTPHRVVSPRGSGRLSCPFFFDPSWDVRVQPLPLPDPSPGEVVARWDGADPLAYDGPYGEYLLSRVAKVFPHLFAEVIPEVDPD
jgi:isopenicillin N synthase-like dioxygenase